jgi:hypothetical protein
MQSESYLHVVVRHQITWFMRLGTLGARVRGLRNGICMSNVHLASPLDSSPR